MIVGILKEIKAEENRVCMTPAGVEVMIQNNRDSSRRADERCIGGSVSYYQHKMC